MLKNDLSIQGSLIPGGESRYTYILHVLFWGMVPFVISLITFSILDHGHPGHPGGGVQLSHLLLSSKILSANRNWRFLKLNS